jgi:hypothetical protein
MDSKRRDDSAPGLFVPNGWHGGFMNCVRDLPLEVFNQVGLQAVQEVALASLPLALLNASTASLWRQHRCAYGVL